MVYPNGRTINYDYGSDLSNTNAALDNAIGRLDAIVDGANSGDAGQVLEQYSYLGLSTIVARNDPQTGINLTLVGSAGSIGSGGNQYVGLDQFGRVVDQNWVNTSTGQSTDNFTYSYDGNSNVTAENNLLDSAYSKTFTYDQLNRLASNTLGGVANQSWTLDSQGNWSSFTSNGITQTQTANAQNQNTSISGNTTPTYDANGNMTTDQNGNTYVYNAWNQLVSVSNVSGQVIAQYTYSAKGYRISESYPIGGNGVAAGTTNYIYYDNSWQAIETRTNGTADSNVTSQTVWSAAYINAAVVQDTYSGGTIQPDSRLYFEQDANWDTTAVVSYDSTTQTWGVTQRYVYSPHGSITILNANWTTPSSGTQPLMDNLYKGITLDPVTGLYYARNRNYSPSLGRWINQGPLQYINGANTYQFVMGNPEGNVDPMARNVYVYDNVNIHGGLLFHQNISVDTSNGGQYSESFGLIPATGTFTGQGEVYLDNGETLWKTFQQLDIPPLLNTAFDAIAQAYLQSLLGKKGPYSVLTNNCRDFSRSQFNKIENMYNQFLQNNANTIQNMMNTQQDGGGEFTT